MKKIAIWAGRGKLPYYTAVNACKKKEVIIIAFKEFADITLLRSTNCPVYVVSIGEMRKNFRLLEKENVGELVMIGKFDKKISFTNMKFDSLGLKLFLSLRNNRDMTIFRLVEKELDKRGIKVISQLKYLKHFLSDKAVLTKKKPAKQNSADAVYGLTIAKKLADLDIGQTIILYKESVVAIEAAEGTDAAIERAGTLLKKGGVVLKVSREKQDLRFDIPTVGIETLQIMKKNHIFCLAVERNKVLLSDLDELVQYADKNKMVIMTV